MHASKVWECPRLFDAFRRGELQLLSFEKLKQMAFECTSASIADVYDPPHRMHMQGVSQQGSRRVFGQAVTLRSLPQRADLMSDLGEQAGNRNSNWPFEQALGLTGPGKVLVIDASGYAEAAVGGDVKFTGLEANGAEGVVTDGSLRDQEGFMEFNFACFAAGWTPQSGTARHLIGADLNVPVSCGRVLVRPDDYVFGDATGVVVVPEAEIETVLQRAVLKERLNSYVKRRIMEDGVNPGEYYPAPPEIRRAFAEEQGVAVEDVP